MKSPEIKLSFLVITFLFVFQSIFSQHIIENRRDYIKKLETNRKKTVYDRNAIIFPKEATVLKDDLLAENKKTRRKAYKKITFVKATKKQKVTKQQTKKVFASKVNVVKEVEDKNIVAVVEKLEEKIETLKVHHIIEEVEDKVVEKQLEKSKLLESVATEKRTRIVNVNNNDVADADIEVFSDGKIMTVEHLEKMLETRRFLKHRNSTVIDIHKCFIDKQEHNSEEQVCQKEN